MLYALLKVQCTITKLESCKMLFFICTVHITRLCVNRDYVFSTSSLYYCMSWHILCAFNVVCVRCVYSLSVNCVFSTSADHVTRLI